MSPCRPVGFQSVDLEVEGPRLGVPIRHTDRKREWAYDRQSHIGKLDKALDEAAERGWTVVNMKRDWNEVYPSKK